MSLNKIVWEKKLGSSVRIQNNINSDAISNSGCEKIDILLVMSFHSEFGVRKTDFQFVKRDR